MLTAESDRLIGADLITSAKPSSMFGFVCRCVSVLNGVYCPQVGTYLILHSLFMSEKDGTYEHYH